MAQTQKRDAPLSNAEKQRRHRAKKARELEKLRTQVNQLKADLDDEHKCNNALRVELDKLRAINAELKDVLGSATSRQ